MKLFKILFLLWVGLMIGIQGILCLVAYSNLTGVALIATRIFSIPCFIGYIYIYQYVAKLWNEEDLDELYKKGDEPWWQW